MLRKGDVPRTNITIYHYHKSRKFIGEGEVNIEI